MEAYAQGTDVSDSQVLRLKADNTCNASKRTARPAAAGGQTCGFFMCGRSMSDLQDLQTIVASEDMR